MESKLNEISEKLDFLIFCMSRNVVKKGALGGQTVEVMPGEELFKQWKSIKQEVEFKSVKTEMEAINKSKSEPRKVTI